MPCRRRCSRGGQGGAARRRPQTLTWPVQVGANDARAKVAGAHQAASRAAIRVQYEVTPRDAAEVGHQQRQLGVE